MYAHFGGRKQFEVVECSEGRVLLESEINSAFLQNSWGKELDNKLLKVIKSWRILSQFSHSRI